MAQTNEESTIVFDNLVDQLTKNMDRMFEELDDALNNLKDFLIQNDAVLDEGITFEIILTNKAKPYVERRKQETKALIINAIAYQENFDF